MITSKSITLTRTATLQSLLRQYNDATTIAAKAESAFESYSNKAQLFQNMVTTTTADLNAAKAQWNLFLTVKSSLKALEQISDDSNEVAVVTYTNISKLVKKWEQVVQKTLEAAEAINLASDFINKRKAANAQVSNDLVADATTATKHADSTVTLVIGALTASLNTFTASNQAKNSTELTGSYIDMASSALFSPSGKGPTESGLEATHEPLEQSLDRFLKNMTVRLASTQSALEDANMQVAKSKEMLDSANAKVVAAQSALSSAQAAVNA